MTLSRLTKRVWSNNKLSDHTKVNVYQACVISTLLYGSESWTMRAHQEKRLNVFHMHYLRRILGITWQNKVTNKVVLEKAGIPSLYTALKAKAHAMARIIDTDERWPHSKRPFIWRTGDRDRPTGQPQLRFKDICKQGLQVLGINIDSWEMAGRQMSGDTE